MRPGPSAYARPDCKAKPCKMGTNPCALLEFTPVNVAAVSLVRRTFVVLVWLVAYAGDAHTASTQARPSSRSAQVFRESG